MKRWIAGRISRVRDRLLDQPVILPQRDEMETGQWNQWVGLRGEQIAGSYLRRSGCKVLYRNFRAPKGGEIDIVIRDGEVLGFVEVKTRTTEAFGRPARAVDREKEALIIRGANAWLNELTLPEVDFRFDVVEVLLTEGECPKVNHIEGAFQSPQVGLGQV